MLRQRGIDQRRRRFAGGTRLGVHAPVREFGQPELHGASAARLDHRAQAAAEVFEAGRLHADQRQALRVVTEHLRGGEHVLEAGLVQTHLLRAHEGRHVAVAHELPACRCEAVVDRIEHQQMRGIGDVMHQIQALCAAIEQFDLRSEAPAGGGRSTMRTPKPSSAHNRLPMPRISTRGGLRESQVSISAGFRVDHEGLTTHLSKSRASSACGGGGQTGCGLLCGSSGQTLFAPESHLPDDWMRCKRTVRQGAKPASGYAR